MSQVKKFVYAVILFLGFCLLSLDPGKAGAATYYVSPTGSGSTCSVASPCAYTYPLGLALTGANTMYFLPGTYNVASLINLSNSKFNNLTLSGADQNGVETIDPTLVTLGGAAASSTFYINTGTAPEGITIKNMTLAPNGSGSQAINFNTSNNNLVLGNLIIQPQAGTGYNYPIRLTNSTNFLIESCRIRSGEVTSGYGTITLQGTSSGTIRNSIIEGLNGDNYRMGSGIYDNASGVVNVYNSLVTNTKSGAISQRNASGTLNLYNNIIYGNGNVAAPAILWTAGTVNADYNWLYSNVGMPAGTYISAGVNDGGHNHFGGSPPQFTKYSKKGYVSINVDDTAASIAAYVRSIEQQLAAKGMKSTWYVYGAPGTGMNLSASDSDRQILRDLIQRGTIEIGAHTWSHTDVRQSAASYATLTHASGASKTYSIDLTNHQFSVNVDGAVFTVNLQPDNSDTFASVLSRLKAHDVGWGATYEAILTSSYVRISSLNDTSGFVSISTKIAFNKTGGNVGFYKDEIYDYKNELTNWVNANGNIIDPQTGVVYTANSFAEPGFAQDATSITAVKDAGFIGDRPGGGPDETLANINIYQHGATYYTTFMGATEADTIANINSMCAQAAQDGRVVILLSHVNEVPATGVNSWTTVINALKPWQDAGAIEVQSMQNIYSMLRNSPWTYNPATGVSTRTYNNYADFSLQSKSPLIDIGTDVSLTSDYAGNPINGTPDIGPYEYQPPDATSDFTIAAAPVTVSVPQGAMGAATISIVVPGNFSNSVALIASGLPTGVTAAFSPDTIAAPGSGSSTLTLTVDGLSPAGTFPVTVTGSGGGATHTAMVTLTITMSTYSINAYVGAGNGSITSSSATANYGTTVTFTITPASGYTLSGLTDNGATATAIENAPGTFTYAITNVSADHTVQTTFAQSGQPLASPVPAMGEWGLVVAAGALGILGMRRRRH